MKDIKKISLKDEACFCLDFTEMNGFSATQFVVLDYGNACQLDKELQDADVAVCGYVEFNEDEGEQYFAFAIGELNGKPQAVITEVTHGGTEVWSDC